MLLRSIFGDTALHTGQQVTVGASSHKRQRQGVQNRCPHLMVAGSVNMSWQMEQMISLGRHCAEADAIFLKETKGKDFVYPWHVS